MKKTRHLTIILALLILSLSCQAINNLTNPQPVTPTLIATLTELPDTPTPTEPTPGTEDWIAFENQNNLWLIHPDASGLTQVTENPDSGDEKSLLRGSLKWSPDGARLAFALNDQGKNSIFLFDTETPQTTTLIQNIGSGFDWLPNGQQIIYDTPASGGDSPSDFHNDGIWVINIEDGKTRQLIKSTPDLPTLSNPQVSTTGNYILFTIPCFEPNCVGYGVADYESGNFIILPAFGGQCEWSPVSLDIACIRTAVEASSGRSQQEIAIFDKLGYLKDTYSLSESTEYVALRWSPDAKDLAIGYYSEGNGQTDILSLENGESRSLAIGLPSAWSPDGQWVLTWESNLNSDSPASHVVNAKTGEAFSLAEGIVPVWQPAANGTVTVLPPGTDSTATPTLIPVDTVTPTPEGPCIELTIKVRDTAKGDYLQICAEGIKYEVGPLEKGGYVIGPNKMFFVYTSNSGIVYAARVGDTRLTVLGDVKDFLFVKRDRTPQFEFQFYGDQTYTVEVHEMVFDQKKLLPVPRRISAPN